MAFTRQCFTSKLLCTNQSSFNCPLPPALPALLQYVCTSIAQYMTPPPPFPVYTIHHIILVIAISCKGQAAPHSSMSVFGFTRIRLTRVHTSIPPLWYCARGRRRIRIRGAPPPHSIMLSMYIYVCICVGISVYINIYIYIYIYGVHLCSHQYSPLRYCPSQGLTRIRIRGVAPHSSMSVCVYRVHPSSHQYSPPCGRIRGAAPHCLMSVFGLTRMYLYVYI